MKIANSITLESYFAIIECLYGCPLNIINRHRYTIQHTTYQPANINSGLWSAWKPSNEQRFIGGAFVPPVPEPIDLMVFANFGKANAVEMQHIY